MSKSILVIDTPEMCIGCMFNDMQFCQAVFEGSEYIEDDDLEKKPNWCPVKEIPKKKDPRKIHDNNLGHFYVSAFDKGYNKCIDEILQ